MKVSENFDIREFVGEAVWKTFGINSTWFINSKIVALAEFYKSFFKEYYNAKHNGNVADVAIVVNNWHYVKGGHQERGFRLPDTKTGSKLSQHKLANAFDCDVIIIFKDGTRLEANYDEIHTVILKNEALFLSKGLTTLESTKIAKTWLHSDCRWIPNQKNILIVKP